MTPLRTARFCGLVMCGRSIIVSPTFFPSMRSTGRLQLRLSQYRRRDAYRRPFESPKRRVASSARTVESSQQSALFISPVWPEPSSSAAGVRTADLIAALQAASWKTAYLSPSKPNKHTETLRSQSCEPVQCPPNREAAFAEALAAQRPTLCIFDRFIAEEAFGFRVKQLLPETLRVLDLQDLHFLRRGREALHKDGKGIPEILAHRPGPTSDTLRELAAIHRSDLALVCSPVELELLRDVYGVPARKLQLAPFFASQPLSSSPAFSERRHFMTIGNFRHPPNLDSAQWLVEELWERMRRGVPPGTELHIYGAYGTSAAVKRLHQPEAGIHLKGYAPSLEVMWRYRVCLAPLRFGAGLKGKIVDGWRHGLPVVTTPIGAEGMGARAGEVWGGLWEGVVADEIMRDAHRLYTDPHLWQACKAQGEALLGSLYHGASNLEAITSTIGKHLSHKEHFRTTDFMGSLLWMQQSRATEYFSKWIELKETMRQE